MVKLDFDESFIAQIVLPEQLQNFARIRCLRFLSNSSTANVESKNLALISYIKQDCSYIRENH